MIDNYTMNPGLVTLSISEAFREGGISPEFLPTIIKSRSNGKVKFALSEKKDCYYTVTLHGCSCDQFISGMYPCPHQIRGWVGDVRELAKLEERREQEQESLKKEKEEEELLKIEEPEKYVKMKQEKERLKQERLKREMQEQERLKQERLKREEEQELLTRLTQERIKRDIENQERWKREDEERLVRRQIEQKKELQERLEEIARSTTSNLTSPKEKARFLDNSKKKLDKSSIKPGDMMTL